MGDSLRRGSIVLAIYPFTDLSSAKRRPALIVSATGRPGRDCILAFITSHTRQIEATDLMLNAADKDFRRYGITSDIARAVWKANDVGSYTTNRPTWATRRTSDSRGRCSIEEGVGII